MSFKKVTLSVGEDVGDVYIADDVILRGIYANHASAVGDLFQSGLIQELIERKLFPDTKLSEKNLPGHAVVYEQKKITPVTYPFEWSPEMLRRAALCVLDVNECCNKYGYELKDGHPYNIVFHFNRPLFVDLGSIVKLKSIDAEWAAYTEFVSSFYYALKLYEKNFTTFGKKFFLHCAYSDMQRVESFFVVRPLFRFFGLNNIRQFFRVTTIYKHGPSMSIEKIDQYFKNKFARAIAKKVLLARWAPFRRWEEKSIRNEIESIRFRTQTQWGTYHEDSTLYSQDGAPSLTPRMSWVKDKVAEIAPATVIDLAGNQGVLSRVISKVHGVEGVICADYDINAIDALVLRASGDEKVSAACFDLLGEEWQMLSNERCTRLRCDLVIALAITHHLILSQKYSIDYIFNVLVGFSRKYIIVEFMPLGLWNGISSEVLPDWYNEEWFVSHMEKHCRVVERKVLEENRTIFLAQIISKE